MLKLNIALMVCFFALLLRDVFQLKYVRIPANSDLVVHMFNKYCA